MILLVGVLPKHDWLNPKESDSIRKSLHDHHGSTTPVTQPAYAAALLTNSLYVTNMERLQQCSQQITQSTMPPPLSSGTVLSIQQHATGCVEAASTLADSHSLQSMAAMLPLA